MKVTIFRNIRETDQPFFLEVSSIFDRIREGKSKGLVLRIRKEKNKGVRNEIKKDLPSICFSGIFPRRTDDSILEHSGLICLDFDGFTNADDINDLKEFLAEDKYTMAVFISPSGEGLKCVVKIPEDPDKHKFYFSALKRYYNDAHFDESTSNVSRVCYESFDPDIYVNMMSETWTEEVYIEPVRKVKKLSTEAIPTDDAERIIKGLEKWWSEKYPMVPGERNKNSHVIACTLCEYGVHKDVTIGYLQDFQEDDFTYSEIVTTVDSAYRKTSFGIKTFMDFKKKVEGYGQNIDETKRESSEAVLENQEETGSNKVFWTINDKGTIKIKPQRFNKFLQDNGFYMFLPVGSSSHVFVRVVNNLIEQVNETTIKGFILDYLERKTKENIYDYFALNTQFFKESFLNLMHLVGIHFVDDTKNKAYLYYENCAVMVTNEGVEKIDYLDLNGYVWKNQVIQRKYITGNISSEDGDFSKFVMNICNKNEKRVRSVRSAIGYLLHGFKNPANAPAVILNDEIISDNPQGGTGKGIFVTAIGKMKRVDIIDGKHFSSDRNFAFQTLNADTQVVCFDDVKKYFDFEKLFPTITEGITIEKKNQPAVKVSFADSPKIIITTNYAIKGAGDSHERRKWELEFFKYYNKNYTPYSEFGRMMFFDWDQDEWSRFDSYMLESLVMFMNNGLVASEFINLKTRQFSAETCHEFIEWCGLVGGSETSGLFEKFKNGARVYKSDLFDEFVDEYPDFAPKSKRSISRIAFNRWLVTYCLFQEDITPEEGRDQKRWIRLRRRDELESTGNLFNQ